jgi:hypothetical protein
MNQNYIIKLTLMYLLVIVLLLLLRLRITLGNRKTKKIGNNMMITTAIILQDRLVCDSLVLILVISFCRGTG